MSNSMFYTGLSGLNAAQAALVTTGHNTANVNTAGYSRQSAQIASNAGVNTAGTGYFGGGAKVVDVTRSYDRYLTTQLNQTQSANAALETYSTQIGQIDNLLANQTSGLNVQLQTFFNHVQTMANSPADPSARQQLLSSSQALASQFNAMGKYLADVNADVNQQIAGSLEQVNGYTGQIASLNKQIALLGNATGGQAPNDLLDQRDRLVSDLSQLVDAKVVVQEDGQYGVFVGNGQTLVLGDKATRLTTVSAASDPGRTALATLNAAGKAVEMQDGTISGGAIGGLLQFRNETLGAAQNAVGRMAIALAGSVNAQQRLGLDLNGEMGTDLFSQASPGVISNLKNTSGATLTAAFFDVSQLTTSDYRLDVGAGGAGGPGFTVTRLSDNTVVAPDPATGAYDGLKLSLSPGAAAGESFLVQPTRAGATDLSVRLANPAKLAAASPVASASAPGNRGSGVIGPARVDAAYVGSATQQGGAAVTLKYDSASGTLSGFPAGAAVTVTLANGAPDPAGPYAPGSAVKYAAGASMTFDGITVSLSGAPANGDTFKVAKNAGGASDGGNALRMGALQNQKTMAGGASFSDAYSQLVSSVGNKARQVEVSNAAQTSLTSQIRAAQQSVSGVNQDEETANLLMFQQMYQASAKVIQTASTLFDTVLGIAR